jgi:hypothetical protein
MSSVQPANLRTGAETVAILAEFWRGSAVLFAPVIVFCGLFVALGHPTTPPGKARGPVARREIVATSALVVQRPVAKAVIHAASPAPAPALARMSCAPADPALAVSIVNREEVAVLASPGGAPVEGFGGEPLMLDPRAAFHVVEKNGGWVRINIQSPEWPPLRERRSGWIEGRFVQRVANADEKKCLFVDFSHWTGVAPATRQIMRLTALRLLHEDRRCARISRGGYIGQGERFFLSCYPTDGGRPYHYWLSTEGSAARRNFAPSAPVDRREAAARCRSALIRALVGREQIDAGAPDDVTLASSRNSLRDGVYRAVYSLAGDQADGRAYCFEPPGGAAEITLR